MPYRVHPPSSRQLASKKEAISNDFATLSLISSVMLPS